jgi:hypothetical protein
MVKWKRTVFELSEHINLIITIKEKKIKKFKWKHDKDRSKIETPSTHDRSLTYLVQPLYKCGGIN